MASFRVVLLLNAMLFALPSVECFGARLDPLFSHHEGYSSFRGETILRVSDSHGDNDNSRKSNNHQILRDINSHDEQKVSFDNLLDAFDFPPAAYENINDFELANRVESGLFSHLRQKADELSSETFGMISLSSLAWNDDDEDCGEDCFEQCNIPEEWKKLPMMMEPIDVMEFLGITRVQPL